MVLNSAAISITSEVLTFAFRSMLWLISEYDSTPSTNHSQCCVSKLSCVAVTYRNEQCLNSRKSVILTHCVSKLSRIPGNRPPLTPIFFCFRRRREIDISN